MKAARIDSYGGSHKIQIEEVPSPTIKDNQILVEILDAGVNPVDWKIREGYLKEVRPARFPMTLGQDFAGRILEIGPRTTHFKVGDHVFGFAHGSYAQQAVVTEDRIAKIPHGLDFATAASIPTAGLTAFQLIERLDLKEGQKILIHGAGGGVGSFAVQLALLRKALVYATASDVDFDYLHSLGISEVIDYKRERFEDRVQQVDAVIDLVGGQNWNRSLSVLREGGIIATTVGPTDEKKLQSENLRGFSFMMQQSSSDLEELAHLVQKGKLRPRIHEVLPLEEARRAQEDQQKGHAQGKIILEVRPSLPG